MAQLTLQRDGQGCAQRSWAPRKPVRREGGMVIPFPRPRLEPSADFCPITSNDQGRREIAIRARRFVCIGQAPPHDHPRVFLTIRGNNETVCPYCYTKFRFDPLAV